MDTKIDLLELIKGKYTYPTWSTGTQYKLCAEIITPNTIQLYYSISKSIMKKRKQRIFPRYIHLTPGLCWALGFFKGEGLSSLKSRGYYRVNITNKNPVHLKKVLTEFEKAALLPKENIKGRCFQIHHFMNDPITVKKYWAEKLGFPEELFSVIDYNHNLKREGNGVCHFDLSEVLLRRVLDLLNEKIIKEK